MLMIASLSTHLTVPAFLATQHRALMDEQLRTWDESPDIQADGHRFARSVFESTWSLLGPLHLNSGYRCPALNAAVGGARTSRHMLGLAADIVPVKMSVSAAIQVLAAAISSGVLSEVDQAIVECGTWIHIQGAPAGQTPRRQVLASADGKSFTKYTGGVK